MRFQRFIINNLTTITSGVLLVFVAAYFYFLSHPPRFHLNFSQKKPGVLIFESPDSEIAVNKPFTLTISVDSNRQYMNAVGLYLRFETSHLQLLDLDTTQSFCQFYPEKKFDNQQGTINLVCGSPHPGTAEKNAIVKLEFLPVNMGTTNILVDPHSKILLSDGKGTNILQGSNIRHQLTIKNNL